MPPTRPAEYDDRTEETQQPTLERGQKKALSLAVGAGLGLLGAWLASTGIHKTQAQAVPANTGNPISVTSVSYPNEAQTVDAARSPCDVNGDGVVTPLDALLIINKLNDRTPAIHTVSQTHPTEQTVLRTDVDRDGMTTPRDALEVIHTLNTSTQTLADPSTSY